MHSRGYDTHTTESDGNEGAEYSKEDTEEDVTLPRKHRSKSDAAHTKEMKKPVLVDSKGIPYRTMKKVLEQEVKLLAKDLDPCHSWEGQPQHNKDHFFKQVYAGTAPTRYLSIFVDIQGNVHLNISCAPPNFVALTEWKIKGKGNGKKIDEMWF